MGAGVLWPPVSQLSLSLLGGQAYCVLLRGHYYWMSHHHQESSSSIFLPGLTFSLQLPTASGSISILPVTEVQGPLYLANHRMFIMTLLLSSFLLCLCLCLAMDPHHLTFLPAPCSFLLGNLGLASASSVAFEAIVLCPPPCGQSCLSLLHLCSSQAFFTLAFKMDHMLS